MEQQFLAFAIAKNGITDSGSQERKSIDELLNVLLDANEVPATLCFYTEGLRWLTAESPVLEKIKEVNRRGADIVVCRSCLAEAGMIDEIKVGRLDTHDHIDDILRQAEHAIVV